MSMGSLPRWVRWAFGRPRIIHAVLWGILGALIICSAPYPPEQSRNAMRWRQIDRLKTELAAAGSRHLFLASGNCPAVGREVPDGREVFVLYGVGRL